MKAAASTWVLPPQLGPELGLPSQSPVSVSPAALHQDRRQQEHRHPPLPPTHTPFRTLQLQWPFRRKGRAARLQGTAKILLTVHNRKLRPREGCRQGGSRENPISQAWEQLLLELQERYEPSCHLLGNSYVPDTELNALQPCDLLQPARQAAQMFYRSGNKLELSDLPKVTQETTDVGFIITFQHGL